MKTASTPGAFSDAASRWDALANRNTEADGTFFYAVRTTGVFCRPSCASRPAAP